MHYNSATLRYTTLHCATRHHTSPPLHYNYSCSYNYSYSGYYSYSYNYNITTTLSQLQLQLHYKTAHYKTTTTTTATATTNNTLHYTLHHTTFSICGWGDHCNHSKKHNFNQLFVHQWIRFAIRASQQLTSPIVSYLWNSRHRLVRHYWYMINICIILCQTVGYRPFYLSHNYTSHQRPLYPTGSLYGGCFSTQISDGYRPLRPDLLWMAPRQWLVDRLGPDSFRKTADVDFFEPYSRDDAYILWYILMMQPIDPIQYFCSDLGWWSWSQF